MSNAILAQVGSPYIGHGFPPHWGWYIIFYFFLGGLAAGAYFIATLLRVGGDPRDRETIRLGYLLAFPLLMICTVLLIVDLGVPIRFWHMVIQSQRPPVPIVKPWSPISLGTWILTSFGLFSFVAFVGALVDMGRLHWPPLLRAAAWARTAPRGLAQVWHVLGTIAAFALAGYTGVLVTSTTIPAWHNARPLGALFLASAASTSYALLMLLLSRRGRSHADASVRKLERADRFSILLELLLIALLLLSLGSAARPFITGGFGVVFWLGVVGLGLIVPLLLQRGVIGAWGTHRREIVAAMCVLLGGLLLRFVVVMSPQYPAVHLWHL